MTTHSELQASEYAHNFKLCLPAGLQAVALHFAGTRIKKADRESYVTQPCTFSLRVPRTPLRGRNTLQYKLPTEPFFVHQSHCSCTALNRSQNSALTRLIDRCLSPRRFSTSCCNSCLLSKPHTVGDQLGIPAWSDWPGPNSSVHNSLRRPSSPSPAPQQLI